ncbi:MAG TPA: hypothetical protein VKB50_30110 [Vicinamibacterales bacterium]|nr:hypothetical protein [Vicinamibacterales bacterium]
MDELPDLRTDEDVDALLARLRAKIAPSVSSSTDISAATDALPDQAPDALTGFIAAHGDATATMVRALKVLADAIDDLAPEGPRLQASGLSSKASSGARGPSPKPSRSRRERRR